MIRCGVVPGSVLMCFICYAYSSGHGRVLPTLNALSSNIYFLLLCCFGTARTAENSIPNRPYLNRMSAFVGNRTTQRSIRGVHHTRAVKFVVQHLHRPAVTGARCSVILAHIRCVHSNCRNARVFVRPNPMPGAALPGTGAAVVSAIVYCPVVSTAVRACVMRESVRRAPPRVCSAVGAVELSRCDRVRMLRRFRVRKCVVRCWIVAVTNASPCVTPVNVRRALITDRIVNARAVNNRTAD